MANRNWSVDETRAAFALYLQLPSGKWDKNNDVVKELASKLGRTPGAVVFKLGNLRSRDPQKESKGLVNASKLDQQIWDEYEQNPEKTVQAAVASLDSIMGSSLEPEHIPEYSEFDLYLGEDMTVITTARVNQTYFRNSLIENYGGKCCLTGLSLPSLLVASHIKPWKASDEHEKVAADNGILIDALHDKAFDKGLMTLDDSNGILRFVVSEKVSKDDASMRLIWAYNGQELRVPRRFPPRHEFIEYHNDMIFQR
ncbi:MAG: HNH endonuclease [Atopobiaceae bacterium]|jgi:putative restriction endonuclease|nr:HNH endonuclease [Atopobiaceae bacterium]MCI1498964.1 HNH endonuclease [Atopobiaceae bacterium]MCI1540575.1 HNH endonuclease [Atopobiaceae bacterium]